MAEYVSKEYLIKQFQGFSDKLKTIYEKQENIQFHIVDKYSDLTIPTVSTICYVLSSETIGTDEFEKGFYLYDILQATPAWTYIEMGGTSDFELDKWIANETHEVDKFYCYDYKLYKCIITNTDSTFIEDNYELYVGEPNIEEWENGKDYVVGDKVKYNNIIYECIVDHTSSVFDDEINNWIVLLEHYYNVSSEQYELMVTNGLIDNSNKYLYIINDAEESTETNSYEVEIAVASEVWNITHSLKCQYPSKVYAFDNEGNEIVLLTIDYTTENMLSINFDTPLTGSVKVIK